MKNNLYIALTIPYLLVQNNEFLFYLTIIYNTKGEAIFFMTADIRVFHKGKVSPIIRVHIFPALPFY